MGFELKSNKCKKLKVEKSSLTMSCIYKFAQSSICYIFCCKHVMRYLTIVKGTEPKLPFITKHSNVSENKQINLGVSKLFSYHSYICLNKNLPKPYNITCFSSSGAPKVRTHYFLYSQTVRSTPFSSTSGCSVLPIRAVRGVREPGVATEHRQGGRQHSALHPNTPLPTAPALLQRLLASKLNANVQRRHTCVLPGDLWVICD